MEQSFPGPASIDHAALSVRLDSNNLTPGIQFEWTLSINGIDIADFTVTSGSTAIEVSTSFPHIAGPTYVVELRANNDIPIGGGSIALASTGSSGAHWLELSDKAPETQLSDGPPTIITATSATFTFGSSPSPPDLAGFRCSIDHTNFVPCESPRTYHALAVGAHSFEVSAVDAAGNIDPTPATWTWTIAAPADTTPPDTWITDGPAAITTSTIASFIFASSERGSRFECKLDTGTFAPCSRPKGYASLGEGAHSFAVRAIDAAGNVGASSTWNWTVTPDPATTANRTTTKKKQKAKPQRCRKGFRKVKRHGKLICAKKKHRKPRHQKPKHRKVKAKSG